MVVDTRALLSPYADGGNAIPFPDPGRGWPFTYDKRPPTLKVCGTLPMYAHELHHDTEWNRHDDAERSRDQQ